MKTKKNLRRISLLGLSAGLLMNVSCKKDDEVFNDLTGILSFGFTDDAVKSYSFTVDNVGFKIENKDSLPYQFDASSLTAKFDMIAGSTATVNGISQVSGTTKNDFSNTVTYKLTAEDGVTTKEYTVQLNIAKLNPEALQWKQANPNAFDVNYGSQKYFTLNGKHFVIAGKNRQTEAKLYSSIDGKTWTEETISGDFPLGSHHNIVVRDGVAYVVGYLEMTDPYNLGNPQYYQQSISENLYYTVDGTTWTKVAGALSEGEGWGKVYKGRINVPSFYLGGNIYAVGGNTSVFSNFIGSRRDGAIFYPPAGISSTTLMSPDGTAYTVSENYTAEMPRRVFAASYVYEGKMYMAGGLDLNGFNLSDVWSSTDGVNWTLVSDGAFAARHKASTVVYDNKIWMIGGLLSDGTCTSEILVSEDGGVTWNQVDVEKKLPSNFAARCNADVSVDEDGNLWIIGGEYTEVITNEEGVANVEYHVLTDVWTGKLNKL